MSMPRRPDTGTTITTTEYAALRERIARLIRLRLIANTLIPVSTWLAIIIGRTTDGRLQVVFWVGAALLGLDLVSVLPHRWFARRSYTAAIHATYVSAHLSVIMITAILHLTGGFANPLVIFYVLNALAIAIVLQRAQAASVLLTSSIIAYFALAIAELSGLYPPITWPRFGMGLAPFLPLVMIGFSVLAVLSSRLLGSLVESNRALEHRTRQLELAMRDQARLYRTEQHRAEQLKLVNAVTQHVATLLSPEEVMERVVRLIKDAFGYRDVGIGLREGDSWCIRAVATDLASPEPVVGRRYALSEGIMGWVITYGHALIVSNVAQDPRYIRLPGHWPIHSVLCVPLIVKGPVLGALNVVSEKLAAFDADDLAFLQSVAAVVAGAMESGQLFQRAAEERDRLQAVLRSVADGVLVSDPQDHVLLVNSQVCEWWGLPEEQIVGRSVAQVLESLGDRVRFLVAPQAVPTGSAGRETQRATIEVQEPRHRIIEQIASPVLSLEGQAIGHVTVFHDITEARRLEEMREDLTQMGVHDLRSPLGTVANTLEALEIGVSGEDKELITAAQSSVQRVLNLVSTLLDVARLESGQMPLKRERVSLAAIAQETVTLMAPFARSRGIKLTQQVSQELPRPLTDRDLLGRVVVNLVTNGIQFTPKGGQVSIDAALAPSTPREVWFRVRDTGRGIRPEDQAHIFAKFVQIGTPRRGGTGLGLAFCKLVAEAHGGRIWVESAEGVGSTFFVALPLNDES
ncbi:MAG: GAF domain-containing protein [Anaerolineae bacterium]|nr:GAF domain-containing protein [Anaerolineae bacterium]